MGCDSRLVVPAEEAIARLDGRKAFIHTFRNPAPSVLIGADWSREDLEAAFRKYPVEETGEQAQRMGHGLAFRDEHGWLFVETKKCCAEGKGDEHEK